MKDEYMNKDEDEDEENNKKHKEHKENNSNKKYVRTYLLYVYVL